MRPLLIRHLPNLARPSPAVFGAAFLIWQPPPSFGRYARLEEQPKDIEKLTEMANFLASLPERSDELSRQVPHAATTRLLLCQPWRLLAHRGGCLPTMATAYLRWRPTS